MVDSRKHHIRGHHPDRRPASHIMNEASARVVAEWRGTPYQFDETHQHAPGSRRNNLLASRSGDPRQSLFEKIPLISDSPSPPAVVPGINCSQYLRKVAEAYLQAVRNAKGEDAVSDEMIRALGAGSTQMMLNEMTMAAHLPKKPLKKLPLDLPSGTAIFFNTGYHKWEGSKGDPKRGILPDRIDGIDHGGWVYTDPATGIKMFTESNGSVGTHTEPYDNFAARYNRSGKIIFFAVNITSAIHEKVLDLMRSCNTGAKLLQNMKHAGYNVHLDQQACRGSVGSDGTIQIPQRLNTGPQLFSAVSNVSMAQAISHKLRPDSEEGRAFIQAQVLVVADEMRNHGDDRLLKVCDEIYFREHRDSQLRADLLKGKHMQPKEIFERCLAHPERLPNPPAFGGKLTNLQHGTVQQYEAILTGGTPTMAHASHTKLHHHHHTHHGLN